MPIITITNAPTALLASMTHREALRSLIKDTCAGVCELKLTPRQVSVNFTTEIVLRSGLATLYCDPESPVVVEVEKLYEKPERTREVLQGLSDNLHSVVRGYLREWGFNNPAGVEVFITPFSTQANVYTTSDSLAPAGP